MIDNKCANCGGELSFDPISQELKCDKCSSIFDIPEQSVLADKTAFNELSQLKTSKAEYAQYSCATCGRKHTVTVDQTMNNCPSCGDANLTRTVSVDYLPNGIIPFKLNHEMAIKSFKEWLKKRKFAPNNLKKIAKEDKIKGIYLPVYNFDLDALTMYTGIRVETHKDSDGRSHTRRYPIKGNRIDKFVNYTESANAEIPSNYLREINNYDYSKIYAYRTEFLYGWIGATLNIPLQDAFQRAKMSLDHEIKTRIKRAEERYDSRIENLICNTSFSNMAYNYLYVPVWSFNYKYKDKNYNCYINGVSGKVSGKAPKSFLKIFFTVLGVITAIGVGAYYLYKSGIIG